MGAGSAEAGFGGTRSAGATGRAGPRRGVGAAARANLY